MDPFGLSRTTQMTSWKTARTSWTSPSSQSLPSSRRRKAVVNRGGEGSEEGSEDSDEDPPFAQRKVARV